MKNKSLKSRILLLAAGQRCIANCGICEKQTRILYADLDTGLSTGRCCAATLNGVDLFIQARAARFGWDARSTWHHPELPDREQFGINFRSNKPFHG